MSAEIHLNRDQIEAVLPHKGENVFLSEATVQPGVSATATLAEIPVVIGSGQAEIPRYVVFDALAQALILVNPPDDNNIGLLAGIDNATVGRKPLVTESVLLEAGGIRQRGSIGRGHVLARVGDEVLVKAELVFAVTNKNSLK